MAECIKYAFILMPSLIDRLLDSSGVLRAREKDALDFLITKCVSLKAGVVAEDPRETTGLRAILNFGHTVGHAIEACVGYVGIKHGEAIMIGMVAEAEVGNRLGVTPPSSRVKLEELAGVWQLPTRMRKSINAEDVLRIMLRDKKSERNSLNMSLLTDIGRCELMKGISIEVVKDVLEDLKEA
jgi:3-dehydroquinate synthase